jgi:hypothetical protein
VRLDRMQPKPSLSQGRSDSPLGEGGSC